MANLIDFDDSSPQAKAESSLPPVSSAENLLSSFDPFKNGSTAPVASEPKTGLGLPASIAAAFDGGSSAAAAAIPTAEEQTRELMQAIEESAQKMREQNKERKMSDPLDDPFKDIS
eukprot:TRINITY_DN14136_c0_g4_i1.p1 TRINITY_DN14136_c0_g4~~TRINITY_DN14136_c0_g4_i1.p1  ORF type:complete len:116 (-),score=36.39 TRINITY_DN14136_c0_g4_i1:197-544(-)